MSHYTCLARLLCGACMHACLLCGEVCVLGCVLVSVFLTGDWICLSCCECCCVAG